jgi:hypothetical protein
MANLLDRIVRTLTELLAARQPAMETEAGS